MIIKKTCKICGNKYPATTEFFYKAGNGLRSECKKCNNLQSKRYRNEHKKRCRERSRKYRKGHKEKIKAYRENHREYHRAYDRKYYKGHKEKKRVYDREYRKTPVGYLQRTLSNIKQRCYDPDTLGYRHYGGKGIKNKFKSSDEFVDYVLNVLKVNPVGLEIHRIDNDGHYERGNIEFLTSKEHRAKHKK